MSQFTFLTIKDIIRKTPSAVSLVFEIPTEKKEDFSFIAGQFLTLKATIDNEEVRRAYSISSQPNQEDIQISVKKISDGKFSTYANESLNIGDSIEVMIPEGKFQLHPNTNNTKDYMAFAAGSGITPIMSMIKTVLSLENDSKFVLIYGNKNSDETMFQEELLTLRNNHPNRLFIEFVYSQENTEDSIFGRIEKSTVNFAIKNKYKSFSFKSFYLCGPEGMIETVTNVLCENGISKEMIHHELFTSSNINPTEGSNEGIAAVTVTVDDEEFKIETDKKVSLLEALLKNDIDAPYSCRGGVCCSCICRVTEGEADMPINNLLTDSEVAEGLILACQSYAKSDTLKLNFDDA